MGKQSGQQEFVQRYIRERQVPMIHKTLDEILNPQPVAGRVLLRLLGYIDRVGRTSQGGSSRPKLIGDDGEPATVVAAVLPEACSRHASPVRPHAITALVGGGIGGADASVIAVLDEPAHAGGAALAIGRAFPLFSAKQSMTSTAAIDTPLPAVSVARFLGFPPTRSGDCDPRPQPPNISRPSPLLMLMELHG